MGAAMLDNYPKIRDPLPDAYRAIYQKHYKENREGTSSASSIASKMERWMHKQVALDSASITNATETLEIGAGTLNQLGFEPDRGSYDIVEPFTELYEQSPLAHRIRNVYADINQLPNLQYYDRITSVAAFEHICNLPEVIATCGMRLNPKGQLRIAIPSEGTWLWTLGWKLTTGLEFRLRHGLDYGLLMRHEHVNSAKEIDALLHYFFATVRPRVFGLCKGISFYQFFACSNPILAHCDEYLSRMRQAAPA